MNPRYLSPILLAVLVSTVVYAKDFVAVRSEIEITDWSNWHQERQSTRCTIGELEWMMETSVGERVIRRWFTGTNLVEQTLARTGGRDGELRAESTKIYDTFDGNPGRPEKVVDLMYCDMPAKITWLAFCSSPALKNNYHKTYPPDDLWKESSIVISDWKDVTKAFPDSLGLPEKVDLLSTNGQPIFQYRVRASTNVFDWNFPLAFSGIEYVPSNGVWTAKISFNGKVSEIAPGTQPIMPASARTAIDEHRNGLSRQSWALSPRPLYLLKTATSGMVALTNWPSSSRVDLRVAKRSGDEVTFTIKNRESHSILLWDVRVQTPSGGRGTDGFGWDSVQDDYPHAERTQFNPGESGEFTVRVPDAGKWRVCVLYSIDWKDNQAWFGNYEAISEVLPGDQSDDSTGREARVKEGVR